MKRRLPLLLVVIAASCNPAPPKAEPRVDAPDASDVIGWALGSQHRTAEVRSVDAYLLRSGLRQAPPPGSSATSGCFKASSFLPAPAQDGRIFVASEGRLQVLRAPGERPLAIAGGDPAVQLALLLAVDAGESPLHLLAAATTADSSRLSLWRIAVAEASILDMKPAEEEPACQSMEEFFRAYRAPRCRNGEKQCLLLGNDRGASVLSLEATRHAAVAEPIQVFGDVEVIDVAWVPKKADEIYLLLNCQGQAR